MKTMTISILVGFCAALAAAPAPAQVHDSILRHYADLHSAPDEYYFFEDDRKQVVDYKQPRVVRICAGESRHLVPLEVTHDGETSTVRSGDCLRIEAESVSLAPAEELQPNYVIKADVETIS